MSDFKGRHFGGEIVFWAVRWYCRYPISYRDLETMMTERGVAVDHSTIYRWVQHFAPEMERRLRWQWRWPRSRSWRISASNGPGTSSTRFLGSPCSSGSPVAPHPRSTGFSVPTSVGARPYATRASEPPTPCCCLNLTGHLLGDLLSRPALGAAFERPWRVASARSADWRRGGSIERARGSASLMSPNLSALVPIFKDS